MKNLHSVKAQFALHPDIAEAAARLWRENPEMRFRLTGTPYDPIDDSGGSAVDYRYLGRWTAWVNSSIYQWATRLGSARDEHRREVYDRFDR